MMKKELMVLMEVNNKETLKHNSKMEKLKVLVQILKIHLVKKKIIK